MTRIFTWDLSCLPVSDLEWWSDLPWCCEDLFLTVPLPPEDTVLLLELIANVLHSIIALTYHTMYTRYLQSAKRQNKTLLNVIKCFFFYNQKLKSGYYKNTQAHSYSRSQIVNYENVYCNVSIAKQEDKICWKNNITHVYSKVTTTIQHGEYVSFWINTPNVHSTPNRVLWRGWEVKWTWNNSESKGKTTTTIIANARLALCVCATAEGRHWALSTFAK